MYIASPFRRVGLAIGCARTKYLQPLLVAGSRKTPSRGSSGPALLHGRRIQLSRPRGDVIRINNLLLTVSLGGGSRWPSTTGEAQPILVSLSIGYDLARAANTDELSNSIDYSSIYTAIAKLSNAHYDSLETLSDQVLAIACQSATKVQEITAEIVQVKAPLHSKAVRFQSSRKQGNWTPPDHIFCDDLTCQTIVGVNPRERLAKQTVVFNISIERYETLKTRFDFHGLTRRLYDNIVKSSYLTLEALASFVALETLRHSDAASDIVTVRAAKPAALVLADSAEVKISRHRTDYPNEFETRKSDHLTTQCHADSLAGITSASPNGTLPPVNPPTPSLTSFRPLSSLLSNVITEHDSLHPQINATHIAVIALGTNMGDRFANIEVALRLLEAPHSLDLKGGIVSIIDTSFMYETAPMYVTDQPMFINCACLIETNLSPHVLLSFMKRIESVLGRTPSIRNGPRVVDLDIITYDSEIIESRAESGPENLEGGLCVPHPRMTEREFVLRPMNDIIPDFQHPVVKKTVQTLLKEVMGIQRDNTPPMRKVLPFPRYPFDASSPPNPSVPPSILPVPTTLSYWTFPASEHVPGPHKVYVMATLNVTPDSFSDGSKHASIPAAMSYATSSVAAGADIIDIGGYSTRPGAAYVSNEEEISRVVPVIHALRQQGASNSDDVPISVDTFREDVARAAVLAGANCINDVYAFTGPEYPHSKTSAEKLLAMRQLARELAVPVVLMHSRGDAGSNKDYSVYRKGEAGETQGTSAVLRGVRAELGDKVDAIVRGRGGVRRWLVMVDPGIGFSKTLDDNLNLLRHASSITAKNSNTGEARNLLAGYPQLIGASKKSFLGSVLAQPDPEGRYKGRQTDAKEREWATAAAVACAVQQGAAVVRVHDVPAMLDVVRVSSALWRYH